MKITKAYIEGLIEGRLNNTMSRCPHERMQSKNEWAAGFQRGTALAHFHNQTTPDDPVLQEKVREIRILSGEKL